MPTVIVALLLMMVAACGGSDGEQAARGFAAAFGTGADGTLGDLVTAELDSLFENDVTRCMKSEGFEYVPEPQIDGGSGRVGDRGALSDEDYASEFGFGIWASFNDPGFSLPDPSEFTSANTEYLESLGEAEAAAWSDQLGACSRQGLEALEGYSETMNPFYEAQFEIQESVAADSRVIAAEAEWVSCMGGSGFPFPDREEMFQSLLSEFRALPETAAGNGVIALGDENPPSAEGLAFGDREVAIAEASFDCSGDLKAIEHAVRLDLEDERMENDPAIVQTLRELEDLRVN